MSFSKDQPVQLSAHGRQTLPTFAGPLEIRDVLPSDEQYGERVKVGRPGNSDWESQWMSAALFANPGDSVEKTSVTTRN